MTELLEQAVDVVRRLSASSQDEIATTMLQLAGVEAAPDAIDPEHLTGLLEGLAQAHRREFAPPEQVQDAFHRFEP